MVCWSPSSLNTGCSEVPTATLSAGENIQDASMDMTASKKENKRGQSKLLGDIPF